MAERSKLVRIRMVNLGCVGPKGLSIELDNIACLVGANNTGKSTVLRAYELALGTETFIPDRDLCKHAKEHTASVEMWIHIPEGTANIAEKWKTQEDALLLVRSRWLWSEDNNWKVVRQTWDPEINDYSADDRASGLDPVFSSRLPRPFRIGTLEEPEAEHQKLLTLVLQPVADRLKTALGDADSPLSRALATFNEQAHIPVAEESDRLDSLKTDLNRSHNAIFPDLKIDFEIGIGDIQLDPRKQLLQNSHIKFLEWAEEIQWARQGTGSQRALFWTMLQVRSRLNAIANALQQTQKAIVEKKKEIAKLERDAANAKQQKTKDAKLKRIDALNEEVQALENRDPEDILKEGSEDVSLPGYMLLIDEPEVALHPNAIRAACSYLYGLAEDPAWQIMLTTHSPQFIDPLQDHTTIVRLDRCENNPSPRTFRSDSVEFSPDEKADLKMLNRFDSGLSEMFFGQYPILVEGDTEYAVFEEIMRRNRAQFPVHTRPVIVRAHGKHTLLLIMRILKHFKIGFSVLHDSDSPKRRDGKANSAWSANYLIHEEISKIRESGLRVVHRLSVPNCELTYLPVEVTDDGWIIDAANQDKPWKMISEVRGNDAIREALENVLKDLIDPRSDEEPFDTSFDDALTKATADFASKHCPDDPRFHL